MKNFIFALLMSVTLTSYSQEYLGKSKAEATAQLNNLFNSGNISEAKVFENDAHNIVARYKYTDEIGFEHQLMKVLYPSPAGVIWQEVTIYPSVIFWERPLYNKLIANKAEGYGQRLFLQSVMKSVNEFYRIDLNTYLWVSPNYEDGELNIFYSLRPQFQVAGYIKKFPF